MKANQTILDKKVLTLSAEQIEKIIQENLSLKQERDSLADKLSQNEIHLEQALKKIQWFEEQIKLQRQRRFGKSSEALAYAQQEIIFNADE